MIEDRKRPSRLSGFRVCLIGGAFFLALLAVLRPITRFGDCPNTRRGRGGVDVALRAAGAITVATVASCGLFANVVVLCH